MELLNPESLKTIQETAVKAEGAKGKVEVINLPNEPNHIYGVVYPSGELEVVEATPPPRLVMLSSVDQIEDYHTMARTSKNSEGKDAVYFSEEGVVLLLDDSQESQRKDRVIACLKKTEEFELIENIEVDSFTQKEFILLLRTTLADCVTPDVNKLIAACKAVDFSSTRKGSGSVGHGKESLGLDIMEEVTSRAGEIPEGINLSVRVFDDRSMTQKHTLKCLVEIDVQQGTFQLLPLKSDLRDIMEKEMKFLQNMLGECSCPVHYGTTK